MEPVAVRICVTLYCITILGGFLLNSFTLLSIYKDKHFWRHTYYFLASRAVSDILVCFLLPLNIVHLVTGQQTVPSYICSIEAFCSYCFLSTSSLCIAFTAFCRYIQVIHYRRLETFKKTWFLVTGLMYAWLIPILTLNPALRSSEGGVYQDTTVSCRFTRSANDTIFHWNLCFVSVPIILSVSYFYLHIYIAFRRSRMITTQGTVASTSDSANEGGSRLANRSCVAVFSVEAQMLASPRNAWTEGEAPSTSRSMVNVTRHKGNRQEKLLTLSIFVTSITHLIIWILTGCLLVVAQRIPEKGQLEMVGFMVLRMGPVINAVIAYSMNSRLRRATYKMIRKIKTDCLNQ